MAVFAELADGRRLEFPDGTDPTIVQSTVKKVLAGSSAPATPPAPTPATPPAPAPATPPRESEPPNWIERQLAKLPSLSPETESRLRGFAMGAADPSVGLFQLGANAAGQGAAVNPAIAAKEAEYQSGRAGSGRSGLDVTRLAGNMAVTAPVVPGAIPASLGGKVLQGAATGGAFGAAQPVTEGDFFSEKGKQAGLGAVGGALSAPAAAGIARVINPNARERVAEIVAQGVRPTVGQALGGAIGRSEEKLQSVPIIGDAIMAARQSARDQFNRATINKAVAPIGETVNEIGSAGVRAAGDKLSAAYDAALTKLGGVKFDPQFMGDLGQLRQMASGLTPEMANRFNRIVDDHLIGKLSPAGGMEAFAVKQAESEIGKKAASFGSVGGAQGELGDALKQVVSLIRQQVGRSSPEAAQAVRAADEGWANLVRVEGAAKAAKGTEGVFTPGQLLGAVRQADTSVRDRATARGTAMMQDWASAGQRVLGDHYPDSGTAGRLAMGGLGLATGAVNPAIPAALVAGALTYTSPAQRLIVDSIIKRPGASKAVAEFVRENANKGAVPASAFIQAMQDRRKIRNEGQQD